MKKVMLFDLSRGKFDVALLTSRGITTTDNLLEVKGVVVAAGDGGMIHTINDILDHHPELIKARSPIFRYPLRYGWLSDEPADT